MKRRLKTNTCWSRRVKCTDSSCDLCDTAFYSNSSRISAVTVHAIKCKGQKQYRAKRRARRNPHQDAEDQHTRNSPLSLVVITISAPSVLPLHPQDTPTWPVIRHLRHHVIFGICYRWAVSIKGRIQLAGHPTCPFHCESYPHLLLQTTTDSTDMLTPRSFMSAFAVKCARISRRTR